MEHFAYEYANYVNEILHLGSPEWYYKHQVYEIPGIATALLITHDNVCDDSFEFNTGVKFEDFIARMSRVNPKRLDFFRETIKSLVYEPERVLLGWENRTIYFIKGGNHPEYWTREHANEDLYVLIQGKKEFSNIIIQSDAEAVKDNIPEGQKGFRAFEDFVRKAIDALFIGDLGRATPQKRTEPGNEGCEIRDILCQNRAEAGFWKDLKDKYSCSEILFEVKNKRLLTRNDLRQTYCYLKPALGLWGFIVCRAEQPRTICAYNRTLFNNFEQRRGLLIITDDDIRRMIELKNRGHDPSNYLRDKMSEFTRSV